MKKILVIEDDPDVRDIILDVLEAEQYWVIGAEQGRRGVDLAIAHLPDLIICDVMMPELDGYGVLRELQHQPQTATIPFIFLTAKSTKFDQRQGMELGADDYITKPFMRTELLSAIATRLKKQKIQTEKAQTQLDELRHSIALSLPHELRTPLNGILASSELLQQEFQNLEVQEIAELLDNIHVSAKRLYRLIINFLLYADLELIKTDKKRLQSLKKQSTEYPSLAIQEISLSVARKQPRSRTSDLKFNLQDATLGMDQKSFIKILEEVLDNAFKFSKVGTPITIFSEIEGDFYHVSIGDRGRGMSAEQITRLGAYQQFDRKIHEQQGSGLGLSIVKQIVNLYGGNFGIDSVLDRGTTIHILLPRVPEVDDF
ncbi:hybrid sensor histidine kinase/response regulator [Roseofilum capinflatum]|uniref:histidine kinase n=1 Tax=Roseofilum capinflatum BLCC-M114 TaxID=3022440 RepID=A0ABT7B1X1_9CYAN|nr:response regulator [Roseofilum capinflatum]MDJ1173161.1 response regulator [Roseofilum capinflatum BLCC-M114]